jgi:hypothetical protein
MKLSDQQVDIMWKIIEANGKAPGKRFRWTAPGLGTVMSYLKHPGFEDGAMSVHVDDFNALIDHGTLTEVDREGSCAYYIVNAD